MSKNYYSHGKLLLTAEYLVLDGANALAVPTKKGQNLSVSPAEKGYLTWKSFDCNDKLWFEQIYKIEKFHFNPTIKQTSATNEITCKALQNILFQLKQLQPGLFYNNGFEITTELEFARDWGLGSSSTLINSLAQWANVNAYTLLQNTFKGSGYDIACARHSKPILFQLQKNENPLVEEVNFSPDFQEELFFVHLNQKQNSREAIQHYREQNTSQKLNWIKEVNFITQQILEARTIEDFKLLINKHEILLSEILNLSTVKERLFSDYNGSIKSLGGWGGDFILATGNSEDQNYFKDRGFTTILKYQDMVL
ncbi:Mevalonate kinase [Mesonia phycicola]|uniref:Mevalonate kinase n=1 Tax=Mesonia phycicola TaxID=579105 RepID=A0A1M6HHA1_9FLAO|nr:GYDIA family GHMP kinase [Mesonia phycicola]SHJ21606.1 Mevalonate kinase [Mesonia phycicola]